VTRPVVIAAGGTGGHMFPALALARELERRGRPAVVVCDRRGARYLGEDVRHHVIEAVSPRGGAFARLAGGLHLVFGIGQSLLLLRRLRPVALAALGSFAAVPVGLAARLLGIPILVHEQNAVLGRANRLLARRAVRVALSFPETRGAETIPPARRLVTGNPVRAAVAEHLGTPYAAPAADGRLALLVVGGSQGARVLSDVVPAAIGLLPPGLRARIALTPQCRPEDLERVRQAYADIGFAGELRPFFEDLPARLAGAHLVISRSGASSVAELLALGRPAILVPYRFAADDHQRANAEAVADAGAAWMIAEGDLTPDELARRLEAVLADPGRLDAMAGRAKALGRPDAAAGLADAVQAIAGPSTVKQTREALA